MHACGHTARQRRHKYNTSTNEIEIKKISAKQHLFSSHWSSFAARTHLNVMRHEHMHTHAHTYASGDDSSDRTQSEHAKTCKTDKNEHEEATAAVGNAKKGTFKRIMNILALPHSTV